MIAMIVTTKGPRSKFLSGGGGGYFWLRYFCQIIFCLIYFYFCKKMGGGD